FCGMELSPRANPSFSKAKAHLVIRCRIEATKTKKQAGRDEHKSPDGCPTKSPVAMPSTGRFRVACPSSHLRLAGAGQGLERGGRLRRTRALPAYRRRLVPGRDAARPDD